MKINIIYAKLDTVTCKGVVHVKPKHFNLLQMQTSIHKHSVKWRVILFINITTL